MSHLRSILSSETRGFNFSFYVCISPSLLVVIIMNTITWGVNIEYIIWWYSWKTNTIIQYDVIHGWRTSSTFFVFTSQMSSTFTVTFQLFQAKNIYLQIRRNLLKYVYFLIHRSVFFVIDHMYFWYLFAVLKV